MSWMLTQQLLQLCWVTDLEGFYLMYKYMITVTASMPLLLQSAVHASGYSDGLSGDV